MDNLFKSFSFSSKSDTISADFKALGHIANSILTFITWVRASTMCSETTFIIFTTYFVKPSFFHFYNFT